MVNKIQILRSTTFGTRPATGVQPAGAPYVNFADKQFGVVDSGGAPQDLVGVPYFSTTANYAIGQTVNYQGLLYTAKATMSAGAWNAANWNLLSSNAVRYDVSQGLTVAQQIQGRQNIYAAPLDAMAYNGMQINGACDVSQANGFDVWLPANGPICDNWSLSTVGSAVVQSTATTQGWVPGYSRWIVCIPNTASISLAAGDAYHVYQFIEGYRIARLGWGTGANAQPITIGFWTMHHRPGLYSVAIGNNGGTRSYVTTYTHNAADTPQWNTVTIPGDTIGTWYGDNRTGMGIIFSMGCGTTYSTAPGSWKAGNFLAATGQINAVAATTDNFRITGVIVLPGSDAPSAARAPFIMRPYPQELFECHRYYYVWNADGLAANNFALGLAFNATLGLFIFRGTRSFRAAPSVGLSSLSHFGIGAAITSLGATICSAPYDVLQQNINVASGLVAGQAIVLSVNNAAGRLYLDARLS